jgi:KaiC/GvpD/RAD55 family RecA-like ATPase
MPEELSTGVAGLDRRLDGGLEAGSLLAIVTPPAAQSNALIHELMEERPTRYITTMRSLAAIERELDLAFNGDVSTTVEEVSDTLALDNDALKQLTDDRTYTAEVGNSGAVLDDVYEQIQQIDGGTNLVIDAANPLERSDRRNAYQGLLNELKETVLEEDSLGVLHCITLEDVPSLRETTLTTADVVWELDIGSVGRGVEFQMQIPKNRTGTAVLDDITLKIGREVRIDDSRNI